MTIMSAATARDGWLELCFRGDMVTGILHRQEIDPVAIVMGVRATSEPPSHEKYIWSKLMAKKRISLTRGSLILIDI